MRSRLLAIWVLVVIGSITGQLQAQGRNTDEQQLMQLERDSAKAKRIYGDTAVVTGRSTYSGLFEGVKYTNRQVLFTDIWVKKDGRWQEVASHATLIAAQQQK